MGRLFTAGPALIGRMLLIVFWILAGAFDTIFSTWIFPLLGLIFLPFTTLFYSLSRLSPERNVFLTWMLIFGGLAIDTMTAGLAVKKPRY